MLFIESDVKNTFIMLQKIYIFFLTHIHQRILRKMYQFPQKILFLGIDYILKYIKIENSYFK